MKLCHFRQIGFTSNYTLYNGSTIIIPASLYAVHIEEATNYLCVSMCYTHYLRMQLASYCKVNSTNVTIIAT